MTSGKPKKHNLQVQINKQTTITSLKKAAPQTVAHVEVEEDNPPSPNTIRNELIEKITV